MSPQQIADIMRNQPPDFIALYGADTPALHAAVRTYDTCISVIETLAAYEYDDWTKMPEAGTHE